jgi:molecular chaperone HtpG
MYTQPLDAIREYVQNAMDSIRHAEQERLLRALDGRIDIEVSRSQRQFRIRDNGVGIPTADAATRLLNVGMSNKEFGKSAGFRGIGRLAGIAYCRQLTFRTSADGEDRASEIVIDCAKLRAALAPRSRQVEELADVLARHSTQTTEKCAKGNHFFEVVLDGVSPEDDTFVDPLALEDYLCQTAPVPIDATKFLFAPKISKWLKERRIDLPQCNLYITEGVNTRQVLKPYRSRYPARGSSVEITDVELFADDSKSPAYWGWYALAPLVGSIEDEKVAGFRLRHHNICIGGTDRMGDIFASLSDSGQYRRFNRYYVGEVHVLDDAVVPNARRDGFEDNAAWRRIRRSLMEFAGPLKKRAYDESDARNQSPDVLVAKASKTVQDVSKKMDRGLASKEEGQLLVQRVSDDIRKLERAKPKALQSKIKELSDLKQQLENGKHYATEKLPSSLSRKEKSVVRDALEVAHRVLSKCNCGRWEDCYNAIHAALIRELTPGKKD